jgi:peptidoglycan-associated lipoprotein
VTLVGGADGRGTEEYNFALGDRRARTVQTYLTGAGVEAQRLRVHSVGEEWASGEDDESMARDRRVDPAAR